MTNEIFQIIEFYQPLFNHIIEEYGLTLTQSQMDEILRMSEKVIDNFKSLSKN